MVVGGSAFEYIGHTATFVRNHAKAPVAAEFFTVVTVRFHFLMSSSRWKLARERSRNSRAPKGAMNEPLRVSCRPQSSAHPSWCSAS